MASSSSSFPPPHPRPYEVFLSFRGDDTRNNFVSHLHSALNDRGIRTYFDETNLQNGQTINIELVKAIEESAIAIIVLSQSYGTSTWCLNELLKIVACKNKLIIYPIFYDVEPSDVRKQTNSFFEAFETHEVNFEHRIDLVNAWRDALTEVGNLTGVDLRGKNEASCIKKIVGEILRKLPLKSSNFAKSLVGVESRISEIKGMIYSHPYEVRFIGIWGLAGVGKTATARAVFEECKSDFESSCFLPNVSERKNELEKLQNKLLSQVLKAEIKDIEDVFEGSSMIQKRLCFKRVLLVIDDVDSMHQLSVLAGKYNWFGEGSRIIITTRDGHLLNYVHEIYTVDPLPYNEAMDLFLDHSFKNETPDAYYMELSHQLMRHAGGFPLDIESLGDSLYGREKWYWQDTLSRVEDYLDNQFITKSRTIFDGLNSYQQDIFLDIACYFRGHYVYEVIEHLSQYYVHIEEDIRELIQKSLIFESSGPYGEILEMHDLLRDMGIKIGRQRVNGGALGYNRSQIGEERPRSHSEYMVNSLLEEDGATSLAEYMVVRLRLDGPTILLLE